MKRNLILVFINLFSIITSCTSNIVANTSNNSIVSTPSIMISPTSSTSVDNTILPTPSNQKSPSIKPTIKATPKPTPTHDNTPLVKKILLKTKQKYSVLNNYSGTLEMFSKRNDETQKDSQEITTSKSQYVFQAPRSQMFKVIEHSNKKMIGSKMIWKGETTAQVKSSGILGLLTQTLHIENQKLLTNRGWSIDKMDHVAVLKRALNNNANLTLLGKTEVDGRNVYLIKITNVLNELDNLVTSEEVAIDTRSFLIVGEHFFKDTEIVFRSKISIQYINSTLPLDTFEI